MLGSSRASLAAVQGSLDSVPAASLAAVSSDLYSAADLLSAQRPLRSVLADSGIAAQARRAVVADVLSASLSPAALDVLQAVAASRWSSEDDLVEAVEILAAQAAIADAGNAGLLDRVEEELFHFGRAIETSPQLQLTLTDPALSAERKAALVTDLLAGRTTAQTATMLAHVVGYLRGRAPGTAVAGLADLAAAHRQRVLAEVRSVITLTDAQQARLTAALERLTGHRVRLNVEVSPQIVGGVVVRIGDEVIDGSLATRLEQARRAVSV